MRSSMGASFSKDSMSKVPGLRTSPSIATVHGLVFKLWA